MKEYFTPGIVLDREPRNELDEAIIVYTKELGKVRAFTKSSRKITSKLSGHLTPGRIARIRFVLRNKLQLVDALSLPVSPSSNLQQLLPFLNFINKITPDADADLNLWYMIEEIVKGGHFGPAVYRHLIDRLGFSGEGNSCAYCENGKPTFFSLSETVLLCASCKDRVNSKSDEFIFLGQN